MKHLNHVIQKFFDIETFKIFFLIACFFYSIPFTNLLFTQIFKVFILWGFLTFVYNFFWNKSCVIKKTDYLLLGFLAAALLSCFFNFKYNLVTNIISVLYLFVQTILMVLYNRTSSFADKIKASGRFSRIIVGLTFPCAVLSIFIFLLNFKYVYDNGQTYAIFGVFEGRLWGIQGNPNSLAQFGLISIWMSILALVLNRKCEGQKKERIFLYINIALQGICCILSNSRSTMVGIFISALFYTLFMVSQKRQRGTDSILKTCFKNKFSLILRLIAVCLGIVVLSIGVKYSMALIAKPFDCIDLNYLPQYEDNPTKDDSGENESEVHRQYLTSDYSNGRFELWSSAAKVIYRHPLLGVGAKNVSEFVNRYMSAQTVTETPELSANMHNIYIQVLVAHGIVAFLLFMAYLIFTMSKVLKQIFSFCPKRSEDSLAFHVIAVYFCLLCSLLVMNLFDANILYFCSVFIVPVFWISISNMHMFTDCFSNSKRKVLFLISNLGGGGAEKVLVDITNNIDFEENEVEVKTIFNEGKYIGELNKNIKYSYILKKPTRLKKSILSRIIKFFPAKFLYSWFITQQYDVEIAFLESMPVRLLCGSHSSAVKLAWVHADIFTLEDTLKLFMNKKRLTRCYRDFDRIVCVSDSVRESFVKHTNLYQNTITIYNPIDKQQIVKKSEKPCALSKAKDKFTLVTIGRLTEEKGYLRLCQVIRQIVADNPSIELWILGEGPERKRLEQYIEEQQLTAYIKLLGFQDNPYAYLKQADLFVSSSIAEGYSLVLAEAMVLGIPVLSTNTSGPNNLLEYGKYGYLVENSTDGLYAGICDLMHHPDKLQDVKSKVIARQSFFKLDAQIDTISDLFALKEPIHKTGKPFCTVFTPAYNRAHTLEKLYASLKAQNDKDFEWVVVDDGSTDGTEDLFKVWCEDENVFPITYIKVENGGKPRAINKGLRVAKGKMFFIVDSDDFLTPNAIERLKFYEETIRDKQGFAGISGLKGYTEEKVIGKCNKNKFVDATNLQREKYNLTGDKAECYYLDLLRRYMFPEIEGEKFVPECVVWDKIAADGYKLRWFNEIIYLTEYLEDGLTHAGISLHRKNPIGFRIYIRNEMSYYPFDIKRKIGHYYRYYLFVQDRKSLEEIADDLLISISTLKCIILIHRIMGKK